MLPDTKWPEQTRMYGKLDGLMSLEILASHFARLFSERSLVLSHSRVITAGNRKKDCLSRSPRLPQPTMAQKLTMTDS